MTSMIARRLTPLFLTQMLGAVNDNLFKNALVVLILFRAAESSGPALVALAGGMFILPYALLSATAGQLADRYDKRSLILVVKCAEVLLMALAAAGFLLGSVPWLLCVLFGLGIQATFFGPLKYAILPQILNEGELIAGNGLIEAGTFMGILAGTIAGPLLFGLAHGAAIVSAAGLTIAAAGVATALFLRPAAPSRQDIRVRWNLAGETVRLVALARANRPVWLCILGVSWFWVMGATLLAELPTLVRDTLAANGQVFTVLLAAFSVGVGIGSMACSRLLRGEVSARLVPFAAIGLSVFLWDFGRTASHAGVMSDVAGLLHHIAGWRMTLDLVLLAACGGIYSVPLYAIIQAQSEPSHLARMIGANNVVNAAAMVASALATAVLAMAGVSPAAILRAAAIANVAVALWTVRLLPQHVVRGVFRAYFRVLHGVTLSGMENLPAAGTRAVIVVNHQSYADGAFVAAFLPDAPTFAVNIQIAKRWWARPFLAAVKFFTVDPANPFNTKTMVKVVRDGETLVVFPEGRITMTGALMKVYDGAGMVADKAGAVLVPVHIDGLQFSRFSRLGGDVPRRLFPPLSLTVLPPVSIAADPASSGRSRRHALGSLLQGVMEGSAFAAAPIGRPLFTALLDAKARFGSAMPVLEDVARKPLSYGRVVLGAAVLGRCLASEAPLGGHIGIMLPNANGAVVTFMALQAFGRVPALLNFSAGAEAMLAACTAAEITAVLSSRAFVERAKLESVVARMESKVRFIWLEDVRASLGITAKLRGWLDAKRARHLPGARVAADAPAVILFTSGSEGMPKGVVLSHRNILANIAQVSSVIDFNSSDRVFNAMPIFHSFGLTGATLLPLFSGVRTFFYPSPLHYRIVPELIYDTDSTIAFGTDTFLSGWARFAHPTDFYRMRYIFAGAEKLRDDTRRLYADRFGVRVLEGYGATETSPVLALNTAIYGRVGTAGRLLPGIQYRLDSVEGIEIGGRLVINGPNVMLGYLRTTTPGVLEPPAGGWYDTGDVCTVDAERFVTLHARARRFAKIAGEMISMPAAEALALRLWPHAAHAVVAVPDRRKGEALVLLTTQQDATASALLAQARDAGAAEIAVPRLVQVVAALPLMASGKVDYLAATAFAEEQHGRPGALPLDPAGDSSPDPDSEYELFSAAEP